MEKKAPKMFAESCPNHQSGLVECPSQLKDGVVSATESEIWRPVQGYEGTYQVSDQGRVRSLDRTISTDGRWGKMKRELHGGILRHLKHTGGYLRVTLWHNGAFKNHYVHKLVLEAFVGPRPNGKQVAHNDGDKANNRLSNLRWASPSENQLDREGHGTGKIGRAKYQQRTGLDLARIIRRVYLMADVNISTLAEWFDMPRTTIADVVNNKVWKE